MHHAELVGQGQQAFGVADEQVALQDSGSGQNFSSSRFCSASSKYIMTLRQKITSLRCGRYSVFRL